jgi:hypothetical protein
MPPASMPPASMPPASMPPGISTGRPELGNPARADSFGREAFAALIEARAGSCKRGPPGAVTTQQLLMGGERRQSLRAGHRSVAGPEPLCAARRRCSAERMFGWLPTMLAACRGQLLRTLGNEIAAAQTGPSQNRYGRQCRCLVMLTDQPCPPGTEPPTSATGLSVRVRCRTGSPNSPVQRGEHAFECRGRVGASSSGRSTSGVRSCGTAGVPQRGRRLWSFGGVVLQRSQLLHHPSQLPEVDRGPSPAPR